MDASAATDHGQLAAACLGDIVTERVKQFSDPCRRVFCFEYGMAKPPYCEVSNDLDQNPLVRHALDTITEVR